MAIQSVAPFEEYVDALQPRFTVTPEAALESAIVDSQIEELRALRAVLASLGLTLPTSTTNITETETLKDRESETTRTETRASGPAASPAPIAPVAIGAAVTPYDISSRGIALDASLRYRAAAALMQEVALLSNYVRDAAVRSGTVPFVVRLLVSVFPTARREPYDVYSAVAFFASDDTNPIIYGLGDVRDLQERYQEKGLVDTLAELARGTKCDGKAVEVIPLFVTDNVESSVLSAGREDVRSNTAGLGGVFWNFGLSASARKDERGGLRSLGRDLNSLFTLGRAAANTLEARLGAFAVEGTFHTVPRTYNLTTLVLMPTTILNREATTLSFLGGELMVPCRSVRFSAQADFRDAETGSVLPRPGDTWLSDQVAARATEVGLSLGDLARSVAAVLEGDFETFRASVGGPGTWAASRRIWPELVTLARRTGKSYGEFDIPVPRFHFFFSPREQTSEPVFPLLDDGETAELAVQGASGLRPAGLLGSITVERPQTKEKIVLHATAAAVSEDGRTARMTFPSPKKTLGADVGSASVLLAYKGAVYRWKPDDLALGWTWRQPNTPVIQVKPRLPKMEPGFVLAVSSPIIAADSKGTGEVRVEIRKAGQLKPKVRLSSEGGHIVQATPPLGLDGADYIADVDRAYVLMFHGLVPGNTLKLHAWRLEGEQKQSAPDAAMFIVAREESKKPAQ